MLLWWYIILCTAPHGSDLQWFLYVHCKLVGFDGWQCTPGRKRLMYSSVFVFSLNNITYKVGLFTWHKCRVLFVDVLFAKARPTTAALFVRRPSCASQASKSIRQLRLYSHYRADGRWTNQPISQLRLFLFIIYFLYAWGYSWKTVSQQVR